MTTLLFRKDRYNEDEYNIAAQYFHVVERRNQCSDGLVIPRYSALPFYRELEEDLADRGAKMANTYQQHRWIADFQYYEQMKEFTPETWDEYEFPYSDYQGPFVVKFRTNSKKYLWKTHMYAENRLDAVEVAIRLQTDSYMQDQGIIYRKFIPLKTLEVSPAGVPWSNEWRFFYWGTKRLAHGYYWSSATDPSLGKMDEEGLALADKIAAIAAEHAQFFVIDIAEKAEGGWMLVEMNDGQMSGLSEIDPHVFYGSLHQAIMSYG